MDDLLDDGSHPATADDLRAVLGRHRRRSLATLGAVLAVVLVAGVAGGYAAGDRGGSGGHTSLASSPATPSPSDAAKAAASTGGGSAAAPADVAPPPSTQVLVRDAGAVRIRLYLQTIQVICPANATCAGPAAGSCGPVGTAQAEVSDEQVAGDAMFPEWSSTPSGLTLLGEQVIGAGQPQPILVAVATAGANIAQVTLTDGTGTDSASPTKDGWVALAIPLAADAGFVPHGTVSAIDASGHTVGTAGAPMPPKPACAPGAGCGVMSSGSVSSGSVSSGSATASGAGTSGSGSADGATVETAPAPVPARNPPPPGPGAVEPPGASGKPAVVCPAGPPVPAPAPPLTTTTTVAGAGH